MVPERTMMNNDANRLDTEILDAETRENIARVLWMDEFEEKKIPDEIVSRLHSVKNRNRSFGERMHYRLQELIDHPESFTPSYWKRYQALQKYCDSLSPHQAYVMSHFLGLDSARGYAEIPAVGNIEFPRDHAPQLEYQVGWHFFVGSCTGKNGKEYGVEMMFWQFSLLTPAIARYFGLTDWENQVLELHLAISEAGDRHYRSPDPQQYPVTHTWYPDHWEFHFGNDVLENLRTFHMLPIVSGGQSGFFANSAQYSEGAVFLVNDKNQPIGRGFAESVNYADNTELMFQLSGIPDASEMRRLLFQKSIPPFQNSGVSSMPFGLLTKRP